MVNYGGDEVSALVLDIGSSSLRAGYAGDDTPKVISPTSYGYIKALDDGDFSMADINDTEVAPKPKLAKSFIGQSGPSVWRSGMEVANPIKGGLINDFGPIHALVEHAIVNVMGCNPSEHPVLVTEPSWNTVENRERMAEIMFEEFQVPAFYISNTGVLNTFAAGKGSALVIDVGQDMASVTPVVDGFVLRKGLVYSSLPSLIHSGAHRILTQPTHTRRGIDLFPHQLIANKSPVEPNSPPKFTLREDRLTGTTNSWRQWYEAREVDEWLQTVGGVLESGWNDQAAASRPPKQYEFPTGYNTWFGAERYYVGEQFFYHSPQMSASNHSLPKTIPALISESLRSYDIELRQVLMGNVVLTGGGSLFSGFNDRLAAELGRTFPHAKIHAPGNPTERRYGGWLGGSILASLGTFHQLWISKEEWQEHGKGIVTQRCK
ncbi:actin-like protein Arp4p [Guyanagaster necrorhizus]|uniref:Actin-like protein Arp4p n=1 Tax=Guyanagaster necrorhizus TaxID=856835 RepID=A0A9P8AVD1_9AGAR|nr:actin-like protein Arp4p [Guyanagaster necrorhizus MCA 3950]KAG7448986.1 actin-like protein Arp4p [Guyanagaster necrorhizus MCA 3950]